MNDQVKNEITDTSGDWQSTFAGEDGNVPDVIKSYESPNQLLEEFTGLKNRDWRDELAGDDQDFRKQLDRFKSPQDFSGSYREAQKKISSGDIGKPPTLSDEPTEDELKQFREFYDVPDAPTAYLQDLPDGLVLGDSDKEIFESFAEALHQANAPRSIGHVAVEWYNKFMEDQQDSFAEQDTKQHQELTNELRQEWGRDYQANMNLVDGLLTKSFGQEAKEAIVNARDPEGNGILNNKAIVQGLAELARQVDPMMQIVSPTNEGKEQALNDEIAKLEKYMRENRTAYNKDQDAQQRLRDLYEIRISAQKK